MSKETTEEQEWRNFLDFVREVVGNSPHADDPNAMKFFDEKMVELEELLFENNP